MNLKLFSCHNSNSYSTKYPLGYISSMEPRVSVERKCNVCSTPIALRYSGGIELRVEDQVNRPSATEWPDILWVPPFSPNSLLLSERVIRGINRSLTARVDPHPATVVDNRCVALKLNPPQYFYLNIYSTIDVDRNASGLQQEEICPACFSRNNYVEPQKLIPIESTWDGSDLVAIRNYPTMLAYCSLKFILLARNEHWTNFRFIPIDVVNRHSYGFKGIDYLGEQWPPEKWYPDPPHAGRTIEQWLGALAEGDRAESHRATLAFLELAELQQAEPAISGLVRQFNTGDSIRRYLAANVLKGLSRRGTPVPPEIIPDVEHEMRDG